MHPDHHLQKVIQEAMMYDLLANYFKYIDPQKHIHYYQKHFQCMQQIACSQQPPLYRDNNPANVRVLHASPNSPRVDIYFNGQKALENMTYYQISPYKEFPAGTYEVSVFPAGETSTPIIVDTITIEPNLRYTVAAAGLPNELQLLPVVDVEKDPTKAKVKFWHLSPNAPAVDIAIKDGDVLYRNVSFGEATDYLELSPATLDIEVRAAGTDTVVMTLVNTRLAANEVYSIVAMGVFEGTPRFEATIIQP